MDERRKFSRILFDTPATLSDGPNSWQTRIFDLCLNGALLETPEPFSTSAAQLVLSFVLPESDVSVTMQAQVVHQDPKQVGLRCIHIDLESISHLRRMVELNLGDASLLNRELEHFIASREKGD